MSSQRFVSAAAVLLVVSLGVFAVADYDNHEATTQAVLFWWLALLGGIALVVGGLVVRRRHANVGTALLVVGCLMALIPTGKTLVLPLLALAVIVLALREHTHQQRV